MKDHARPTNVRSACVEEPGAPPAAGAHASSAGRPAARGVVFLSLSNAVLFGAAYAIHVVAARLLGSGEYGRFVVITSVLFWLKQFQDSILVPGLFKIVSEDHSRLQAALIFSAKWYAPAVVLILAGFLGAAPLIARALGEPALFALLVLGGLELPWAAAYGVSRWTLIAMRHYGRAAGGAIVYSLVRVLTACGLLAVGLGAAGAVGGNALGALGGGLTCLLLVLGVRRELPATEYPLMRRRAWAWTAIMMPTSAARATLFSMDLWLVKALIADAAAAGLYGAAYTVSRLPVLLFMGLNSAVLPRISAALAHGQERLARSVCAEAIRVITIVALACTFIVAGCSSEITSFLFSSRYAGAGPALSLLMIAVSFASFLLLMLAVCLACDHPGAQLGLVAGILPLGAVLNWLLIPRYSLQGAATACLVTFAVGAAVGGLITYRLLRVAPSIRVTFRCAVAGSAAYLVALVWPAHGWLVVGKLLALGALYVGMLVVLGELKRKDLLALRRAVGSTRR